MPLKGIGLCKGCKEKPQRLANSKSIKFRAAPESTNAMTEKDDKEQIRVTDKRNLGCTVLMRCISCHRSAGVPGTTRGHVTRRRIVSGCGGLNEPICRFLDYYLKPCVEELSSYVKDSADVLQRLQGVTLGPDMFLITGDVESLYTCINHEQGISAARFFLSNKGIDGELLHLLLELLEHALTHNYFTFKDRHYVQQRGVAMGVAFTPSYANLFMGQWEREHMLPYLNDVQSPSVVSCMRFIDDLLFIWQGERKELDKFLIHLNDNNWNVKLTFKITTNKIDFLDRQLTVDQMGYIHSTIFRKETSTNSVLHAKSAHPRHTIRAIPKGQFIRAKRICDTDEEFEIQARDMTDTNLRTSIENKVTKKEDSRLRIITNYHGRWKDMNSIFNQFWPILKQDPGLAKLIEDRPLIVARRSKTIGETITHSHYVAPKSNFICDSKGPKWGSRACGTCSACKYMVKAETFSNSSKTRDFKIVHSINCRTTSVIYYLTCPCGLIYVGLTSRQLRIRKTFELGKSSEGRSCETKDDTRSLSRIPPSGPIELQVRGIDVVHLGIRGGNIMNRLAQKECRWITNLRTVKPHGLNDQWGFSSFL
ncbi:unnamed protein product [Ranitomeya imitator]|uniref:Reverse transcriptase domain-containing protein n=1 Tax=Ranitomeya imitator TaxID=111125 RepID=A0ABN9L3B8_9NEOB|nr:unnamed protein product [Ranitomeya imitator]